MMRKQMLGLIAFLVVLACVQIVNAQKPTPVTPVRGYDVEYGDLGSTVVTLAVSSGTIVMTTATAIVQEMRCNNWSASTAYMALTDTAGNLFGGEITAKLGFAIPAYGEYYPILPGSSVKMVGIKAYANTANAINCTIRGKT